MHFPHCLFVLGLSKGQRLPLRIVRKAREGLRVDGGGSPERNCVISRQHKLVLQACYTSGDSCWRTCSADVLTKTGGPFKQFMKTGTNFFKNVG